MKMSLIIATVALFIAPFSFAQSLCSDGSYVGGTECNLAPDGSYVGGDPELIPDGSYVGSALTH